MRERIERDWGGGKARAYALANRGAQVKVEADLEELVRDAAILAREIAAR